MEKYQPSAEEIKKGEESMTDLQADLSQRREFAYAALKDLGVEGYLEINEDDDEGTETISGVINGHKVVLVGNPNENNYTGKIDDVIEMDSAEAKRFVSKYNLIGPSLVKNAALYHEGEIKKAQNLELSKKEAVLKEIGL